MSPSACSCGNDDKPPVVFCRRGSKPANVDDTALWKSQVAPAALGGFLPSAGIESLISAVDRRGGTAEGGGDGGGEETEEEKP